MSDASGILYQTGATKNEGEGLARELGMLLKLQSDKQIDETPIQTQPSSKKDFIRPLVAQELNRLTIKEREEILYEVHGVQSQETQETPETISLHLAAMDKLINIEKRTKPFECTEYIQALNMNPSYAQDPKLKLLFLRTEKFDTSAATIRFLKFWKHKKALFGPEKLGRDINFEDLSVDDKASLQQGYMQLAPSRDRANRAVLFYLTPFMRGETHDNLVSGPFAGFFPVFCFTAAKLCVTTASCSVLHDHDGSSGRRNTEAGLCLCSVPTRRQHAAAKSPNHLEEFATILSATFFHSGLSFHCRGLVFCLDY